MLLRGIVLWLESEMVPKDPHFKNSAPGLGCNSQCCGALGRRGLAGGSELLGVDL